MIFDTIVAPITGTQPAPVGVVRVSGPQAWEIASRVFGNWPASPESHKAVYGRYLGCRVPGLGSREAVDHLDGSDSSDRFGLEDGLALPFAEGHSYTGEQSVELSIHGSPASVRWLVSRCIAEGARMAEPGEFTMRAFLNGRMDLTQAEGVRDTVNASTELQLKQAAFLREGALHKRVSALREIVVAQLAAVEASVDFSEEIGAYDRAAGCAAARDLLRGLDGLIETAESGRIVRSGLRIALVGPPNAGKSSLLNALMGTERAIVTDIPGTTRDYVEEQVSIGGVVCVLFDTAGLNPYPMHEVEKIGIQRAKEIANRVDEVWYVHDTTRPWTGQDEWNVAAVKVPIVFVESKLDLKKEECEGPWILDCRFPMHTPRFEVSALTGEGLDVLREHVRAKVERAAHEPLIQLRHREPLENARTALQNVLDAIEHDLPDDLLAVGLRAAGEQLGQVTGETATPDIIDRIFHDFCIGK